MPGDMMHFILHAASVQKYVCRMLKGSQSYRLRGAWSPHAYTAHQGALGAEDPTLSMT